jgi:Ca2+-binding EF-hand superfamily protein
MTALRDSTTMSLSTSLTGEEARLKELATVFNLFDSTGRGYISTEDLPVVLKSLGLGSEYMEKEVFNSMKAAVDPKRTGMITFDSYMAIVEPCMSKPGSFEEQFRVFRMLDRSKKGYLDLDDLTTVGNVECMGMLSEKQCDFILTQLKSSARSGITFDDFKRAIGTTLMANK